MKISRLSHRLSVAILGGLIPASLACADEPLAASASQSAGKPACRMPPIVPENDRANSSAAGSPTADQGSGSQGNATLDEQIDAFVEVLECQTTDKTICDAGE